MSRNRGNTTKHTMSSEQNQQTLGDESLKEMAAPQDPRLTDVFYITIKHWPWLLLSIIVCVGLGLLYVLITPKSYKETASLVVKNESEGRSSGSLSDFNDLGLFSNNANVMNEIATISSPDVMYDVVKMLKLDVNYLVPGKLRRVNAYGKNLPVTVTFLDLPEERAASFKMTTDKEGKIEIENMKVSNPETGKMDKVGKDYSGAMGVPIRTAAGRILITPNPGHASENLDIEVVKNTVMSAVTSYCSRVKVDLSNDDSTVINMSISDTNRERGDDILRALIDVYNRNWLLEKNQIAVSTSGFINDRLGVIESELGSVDANISSYKSANLVPDVEAVAQGYMDQTKQLSQQILDMEGQLQAARYLRGRLHKASNNQNALPANTMLENPALQSQINEYNETLLRRNTILSKSSDRNPIVIGLDDELKEMRGAILGAVDNAIQSLESRIMDLQNARGAATSKIASNPTQAKYLLSVERQQKVKENLYLFLLQKREDNELNQAFTAYNTRVIKKPGGTGIPESPKTMIILAGCFILGVAFPFGFFYVKERTNTKLRGRKDVEGLATPMFGEIPYESKNNSAYLKKDSISEVVIRQGSRDIVSEAFRVLRTNVEFARVNKNACNVLAITSFNPGSGKSFISMNLGGSIALKNKRVLVIDGDMRRGSTSEYVNSPKSGLADYLAGHKNDVNSLIVKYEDSESLYVLPSGTMPPNPTELIETSRFKEMIEDLRKEYDYIIIDCPPVEVVADAQIISKVADMTVFVIRAGLLERAMLPVMDKIYNKKEFNHMGFILNATRNDGIYGRGYGSGYGYGNGYDYESK